MRRPLINLLLLLSLNLWAQKSSPSNATANLNVSVTVTDRLEMITLKDINIGSVLPSQVQVTVDPQDDQRAGIIKITGGSSARIKLSFTQQVEMVNSTTGGILLVKYRLSGNPLNEQNSSFQILKNPTSLDLSETGDYYIWVGCSFGLENIEPGNYDGNFGIEVDYF